MTSEGNEDTERPRWASRRLGLLIRKHREARGGSQEDLATALGDYGLRWYQSTVNRVESGARTVAWDEAIVICAALGFDLAEVAQSDLDFARARKQRLQNEIDSLSQQIHAAQAQLIEATREEHEARIRAFAELPERITAGELRAVGMGAISTSDVKAARKRTKEG